MDDNIFLAKVKDESGKDKFQWLSQNRTLYADQFTEDEPMDDESRAAFTPRKINEVFEKYKPKRTGVELVDEEGIPILQNFEFREINDFDDDRVIANSPLMNDEKNKIESYNSIIRHLERNKVLRNVLKDSDARENFKETIRILMAELNKNNE